MLLEAVGASRRITHERKLAWFETNDCFSGDTGPEQSAIVQFMPTRWDPRSQPGLLGLEELDCVYDAPRGLPCGDRRLNVEDPVTVGEEGGRRPACSRKPFNY